MDDYKKRDSWGRNRSESQNIKLKALNDSKKPPKGTSVHKIYIAIDDETLVAFKNLSTADRGIIIKKGLEWLKS